MSNYTTELWLCSLPTMFYISILKRILKKPQNMTLFFFAVVTGDHRILIHFSINENSFIMTDLPLNLRFKCH